MALGDQMCSLLEADIVTNHKHSLDRGRVIGQSLAQQLATINNSMVHQHGAVSDDPGNIAMLQVASKSPGQGMNQ